jgi:hypothetical protein
MNEDLASTSAAKLAANYRGAACPRRYPPQTVIRTENHTKPQIGRELVLPSGRKALKPPPMSLRNAHNLLILKEN